MLLERIWDAVRRVGWTVFVKIVNGFYLLPIFVKKAPLKTLKITISKFVSSNKSMILDNLVNKKVNKMLIFFGWHNLHEKFYERYLFFQTMIYNWEGTDGFLVISSFSSLPVLSGIIIYFYCAHFQATARKHKN